MLIPNPNLVTNQTHSHNLIEGFMSLEAGMTVGTPTHFYAYEGRQSEHEGQ